MHTADTETDNNVAIIGLACRFPGSPDPARYWQLLENGEHAIREIPPSRWDPAVHYAPDLDAVNKSVSKWCGLVDDISRFDHRFFGISEREARNLDPQQRLLLEEAWHCIEDAGVPLERLRQARTAVFAGFMASDYHQESANPARTVDAFTALGNYSAILANRISYTLGLSGASVAVDAACASSLVAVHEARRALQRGDADYAIAAGVSLNFHPWKYISFSRARMLSPDGLCKTFDRDANGYVPGDGIGVLLLRPLAAARAAGDHVHGIIAGSAVNHTGRSLSITAPRVAAQRDVIRAAHRDAGWSARTISYLEAHGTGTSLGDPIEVEALTQAFREDTADRQFCGLGSVKSNIGHLEAAAGIAGVIKVLLMMRHRRIPATLHVRTPNPLIRFEDSPFALATEARDWQPDGPRRAGVSSFGFGGANAHVLVEEPGDRSARPAAARDVGDVFVFSARSQASLAAAMARCQAHLAAATAPAAASDASLEDVAATLATGRQAFAVRHGFIARSATELVEQLAAPAPPVPADKFPPTLHFTFVGSPDIASDLGAAHLLAPHLDRLQRALDDQGIERQLPRPGHPLRDGLDRFAAGHAFAAALVDLGAKPAAVTGDGEGIWIALAIAEVLPAEAILAALAGRVERTALRARRPSLPLRDPVSGATWMAHVIDGAYLRALLASAAPAHAPDDVLARARMLAASQFTFKKFLAEWNPTLATLGLSAEEVLGQDLAADDPRASLRWVMAASAMRQLHRKWQLADAPSAAGGGLEELVDLVVDGALSFAGAAALLTSADPDLVAIARAVDSQQHRIDRRQPYRLLRERAEGAGLVEVDDFAAWLDMALAQAPTAPVPGALAAPILDQPLRHTALRLWLQGVDVRWSALFPDGSFTRVPLPGYIFEGRDFWLPAPAAQAPARETPVLAPVIAAPTADAVVADPVTADPAIAERLITSHVIDGRAIAPGALLVSQALAAAERVHGPIAVLRDLRFERTVTAEMATGLAIDVEPDRFAIRNSGGIALRGGYQRDAAPALAPLDASLAAAPRVAVPALYADLATLGYQYGLSLQVLATSGVADATHVFELRGARAGADLGGALDPALLDGMLQAALRVAAHRGAFAGSDALYLPFSIEQLERVAALTDGCLVVVREADIAVTSYGLFADIAAHDRAGRGVLRVRRAFFRKVPRSVVAPIAPAQAASCYRPRWEPRPVAAARARPERALVIVDDHDDTWVEALRRHHPEVVATRPGADLDARVRDLARAADGPFAIYFLAALSASPDDGHADLARDLLRLSQALVRAAAPAHLVVVTRDAQAVTAGDRVDGFGNGLLPAMAHTLAAECPMVRVHVIDVAGAGVAGARAASRREIVDAFASELAESSVPADDVALRAGVRLVRRYAAVPATVAGTIFRDDGTYLLVGGAGGIGLHVAEHIAARARASLVLVGRSALGPEAERRLAAVRERGCRVVHLTADISDAADCQRAVEQAHQQIGPLRGVLHLAGVADDRLIAGKTWPAFERELSAKTLGTRWLDRCTEDDPLDFFAVFSSVVSLIGNRGQIGYAAANGFLDAFMHHRQRRGAPGRSVSVNWGLWAAGGMGTAAPVVRQFAARGLPALETRAALDALDHLLAGSAGAQAVVLAQAADHLFVPSTLPPDARPEPGPRPMTTDARTLDVPPQRLALVEDELRRLVAHALETRAADIDVEESFSALGVESLVLQSITETLEKTYGPLSPTLLFEYPSIRTLARILVERLPATATAAPVLSPIAVPAPIPPSAPAPIPPPAPRSADSRAIAIVGMNGRFPRSPDVDALWQNLVARRDCIDEIPADRWDHQRYFSADAQPDRTYGKWGGFIDGVDHFDPLFFKISPREAEQMDPQQRLFLECVWATMEHAGHGDPRSYQDRNVGLFVGVMWNEYSRISAEVTQQTGRYSGPGSLYWAIANRVSYWMNFTGPSLAIDTACSSSLVALHQACMAIEHGDCEMAIAGGINLSIDPDKYLYLAQSRFLSTDGRCRSFGDGGSGYVPSEGVGAVLLKPLDQALRDGDHVYGVVRSSAVNHGGRATGFTVPNPEAQARLVGRALTRARISPDAIDYIECHGTGTSLGDPIEIAGLTSAYRKAGVTRPKIAIGSIKSNLGHLEATAGIAGLIKVLLCMQHQALPGNLHSQVKNPSIDFERGLFDVVEDLRPWRAADGAARLAGLSSFGAGGANAHVIIESYEPHVGRGDGVMDGDGEALLLLSARSRDRLVEAAARLRDHLRDRIDGAALGDVAYTLQVGRQHMEHRLAIVASSLDEARARLDAFAGGRTDAAVLEGQVQGQRAALLDGDEDDRAYLQGLARNRRLAKLAGFWLQGQAIPWHLIHDGEDRRRVALPSYPFARERYWLPRVDGAQPAVTLPAAPTGTPTVTVMSPGAPAPVGTASTPRVEPRTPSSTGPVDELFFVDRWSSALLEPGLALAASAVRNALIVHTADGASLADALAAAHPGARTTRVTLEPSPDATSLDRAVRAGGGYDAVYFLGGIAADEPAADDIAALDLAQDRGLFGLFRLVKALDAAPGCHLKIVTSDVCAVRDGDPERPFSAGVHGLGRSIAKEYPWLQVSAIDVSSTALRPGAEQRAAVAAVIAEPGHLRGREIAIRDGRRLIRTMERKALPVAARTPYRDGGVYLVIGGAGGLGHLFSRHLAETHRARLVWVGRRPVDAAIQARIDDVRALGGDVLYLQADAGDATALRAAVATARRQLGPLHGAVHSATVLEDQPIASTDEAAFRAGVRAKIAGSIALQHAVAGEHLDFVVYFGSIASYLNNDGASAYAAGCTFQDRYARFQQTRAGHPVRLIQWGYWGGVGAVAASAAVQDRQFSAIGIGAIGVDDGMEAIRRVLSQPAPQVIAARTTRASATDLLGYELRAAPLSRHPTRFASLFERSLPRIQPGRDAVRGLLRYQFSFDQLERFSEDMLACVLDEMGAFAGLRDRGEAITALGQHLGVAARFDRLFESLLAILEDARYLRLADGRAIAGERRPPTADALRAQMERLRGLPEIEPYVTLLWACYHRYADLLTGRAPATDVLFPGGSMEMMGRLYKGNATADHFNQLVSRSLLAFLEARIPQLRACEKIAILEVGAGTGGTSASVLEALAPHATHLEYFYTDISRAFTTYGEREYGARYPFVTFKPLNLENDLAAQGYAREQFDVVLGANVIHATRNLSSTLDSLKVALKTHGWLILNEMTRVVPFLTITAGLLDGWWLFDDEHVRMKWSPLLSSSMWSQLLRRAGFDRVAPLDHRDGNADWTIQNVIVAESNGVTGATALQVALAQPQAASALAASAASAAGPAPTPAPSAPAPAARPLSRAAVEARIVDCLARTLQIEASTLDPEVPFTTFGVDSIFAVEVAEVISRELGIELRTTALFNHPTARSLAEHIVDSFAPTEAPPPAPVSPAPVPVPPALRSPAPSSATPPRAPGASAATSAIDVAQVLADALAISREQIDPGADLAEIGLDAEHVVRVSTQLAALGVHAPAANLLRSASVGALIAHVEHLGSDAPVASASRAASMPAAAPTTRVQPMTREPAAPATIDIAVIGLSCRLPGADSAAAYWQNLCDGRDVIGEIPADRWSLDGFYDPDPAAEGKSYSKWGGFLSDVGHFDPLFFGISPREAELTDPQQRLFLEESYKALEDAGYSAAALDGLRASVFVGCKDGDYVTKLGPSADPSYRLIGNTLSILAARISYFLNLKGPSIPVDTACSSSLVAIHLACQSLLTGDSELAIAGGVALMITPVSHVMLSKTGMLSPTGRCHTFDATADGLVPSEGVAVVVLKPLAAALRDRNHVYGVIRASETNQDGRSNGITAPSSSSQTALELDVYRRSGLHPETIGYVEAHGTGTRLGDPIEVDALTDAFAAFTDRKAFCPIGSVKASIGHTLAASGAASLIKVLLGLEHRTLVPSLHFEQPSPHIDFTRSPFYVNTERRDWPAGETPRRAAVSAFGMSGTNVHMIVEEAPAEARRSAPTIAPFTLVPLSAKTAASLRQKAVDLLAWLDRGVAHELGDLGFTLGTGRSHFAQRAAFVVRNSDDLHGQLVTWLAQPPASAPEPRPSADVQQRAAQLVRDAAAQDATGGLADRLHALADLYRQRVDLDWAALYTGQNRRLISLPSYPFLGRRYWVEETVASVPAVIAAGTAPAVIAADDAPVAYFGASWAPRATEGGPPPRGTVLLLGAPSLHRELAAVGPVIAVERGPWFRDMGDQRYQIAPDQDGDIARLLESLDRGGHRPRHVVHGWALDTLDTDQADPAAPFHAIAALCRGLAARSGPVRIVHAYRERRDRRDASHAAIASLARSLRLDVPQLALTTAAVDDASALPIAAELASGDSAVRYRNGQRTVQVLRPWRASGVHGPAPRTGGVYLITGGLGGLGRAFAAHLARGHQARLVLTGRSRLDARGEAFLRELASLGGEAIHVSADLADRAQVIALIDRIDARFGALHGILHSAGATADGPLRTRTRATATAVLGPKVHGTLHLDEATSDRPLDVFALFSSMTAVLGNLGQTDYGYANGFLGHFAAWREVERQAGRRSGRTVAIDWPLWRDGGMQVSADLEHLLRSSMGMAALATADGLAAYQRAVDSPHAQVLVIAGDAPRVEGAIDAALRFPPTTPATASGSASLAQVRGLLLDAVTTVLKVGREEIDEHASPRDYGLESINVVTLINHLNRTTGLALTPMQFFAHPSLASLADWLAREHSDQLGARTVAPQPTGAAVTSAAVEPVAPAIVSTGASTAASSVVPTLTSPVDEPVAIVGLSAMLPGSRDVHDFWRHLDAGHDLISELPPERWSWRDLDDGSPQRRGLRYGGFCDEMDRFDAAFFGLSPREAELMDPQQRVLLQLVWKAIEDAGYRASDLARTDTGVFVGAATSDYLELLDGHRTEALALTGTTRSILANRISYFFDLRGPSEPIDTACSSALVAIHRAAEAIRRGDCQLAIAGSINAILSPTTALAIARAGMLSPEGRCKTFDRDANGYVRAEGAGVLLLKPLARAVADGDHVYAVVKGSAENHGGRASSLTAPNPQAQADVIVAAVRRAGIDPTTIGYVETHGTGTSLGDPIEIDGLKRAFARLYQDRGITSAPVAHCALGAVKTSVGHLEGAAGIPGILKVVMAMQHRRLPRNLHLDEQNPYVDLAGSPFRLLTAGEAWTPASVAGRDQPLRAGVSSFGFGGSNAHVVLESVDNADELAAARSDQNAANCEGEAPQLIVLSARDEQRLAALVDDMLVYLREAAPGTLPPLASIAYTLVAGREPMAARLACVASTTAKLAASLARHRAGQPVDGLHTATVDPRAGGALLDGGDESRAFVQSLLRSRKLPALARLWATGAAELDAATLFAPGAARRVPLPSYPFAPHRHWVPSSASTQVAAPARLPAEAAPHPMIDARVAGDGFVVGKRLDATAFYLVDHVVDGKVILPGVGHLELARAAGELAGGRPVRVLRDVMWIKPIVLPGAHLDVQVAVGDDPGAEYQVRQLVDGSPALFSRGRIDHELQREPERHDLDQIRARCPRRLDHGGFYDRYRAAGFHYGPSFRVNAEVVGNPRESLGKLVLPAHLRDGFGRFGLHPSLLDASLQAISGMQAPDGDDGPSLSVPFALGRLEIYEPLPEVCYSYTSLAAQRGDVTKYNVSLVDERGHTLVRITDFSARAFKQPAEPRASSGVRYYASTWART